MFCRDEAGKRSPSNRLARCRRRESFVQLPLRQGRVTRGRVQRSRETRAEPSGEGGGGLGMILAEAGRGNSPRSANRLT